MIIDHRTYNIKPGRLSEYLKMDEEEAFPLQRKYLGHCVGWYVSNDIGPLNQIVHMWAFEDLNDRAPREHAGGPGAGSFSWQGDRLPCQHGEQDTWTHFFF